MYCYFFGKTHGHRRLTKIFEIIKNMNSNRYRYTHAHTICLYPYVAREHSIARLELMPGTGDVDSRAADPEK